MGAMSRSFYPPHDVQGICVSVNGDLVRQPDLVISVRDLIVFPRGVVIHTMAWTPAPGILMRATGFDSYAEGASSFPEPGLTWQVQIGDLIASENDPEPRTSGTPWLLPRRRGSFGGDDRALEWEFWLSPISLKKGLRISVDWPERGIVDSGLAIEATTLTSAAGLGSRLWMLL